ncbi:hypothetical protein BGX24_008523 [Mortierella sp. AD032]|nr:hypothetical protein BGX24_008523 [Mortierella sp. AD032]
MVTPTSSTRLMATFAAIKSPFDFDLPALRHRPSCFVTGMYAVSCALVCKDWTYDFISSIWFRVDLTSPTDSFTFRQKSSPSMVALMFHQISLLANRGIHQLRKFKIQISSSGEQRKLTHDIAFMNAACLQSLHLLVVSVTTNKFESLLTLSLHRL